MVDVETINNKKQMKSSNFKIYCFNIMTISFFFKYNNMKSNLLIIIALVFLSCNKQKNEPTNNEVGSTSKVEDIEALALFQQKCYACHSVSTKSPDEIIAPPMVAVKRRYMKEYDSKEDFVKAIVAYANDPKPENALMIGAVDKFKAMPKQEFKEDDLTKIASYIYDNEIETPEWFEDHFQQKHKNGQGMGKGRNK